MPPLRKSAATGGDLRFGAGSGERLDIDFKPSALIGLIRYPSSIRGEPRVRFFIRRLRDSDRLPLTRHRKNPEIPRRFWVLSAEEEPEAIRGPIVRILAFGGLIKDPLGATNLLFVQVDRSLPSRTENNAATVRRPDRII